jgi:KDO2-lipid IV(A) lauroyltransferase
VRRDIAGAERIGERIGRWLYRCSPKHRKRALSNLALAFPESSEEERSNLALRTFEHFGRIAADFLWTERRTSEVLKENMESEGIANLDAALAGGKGALVVTGHFGCWERLLHYISEIGYKGHGVARPIEDPMLHEEVWKIREHTGVELLSRGDAARFILKALRGNFVVGLMPDQNSDESFLPFFGRATGTALGPAVLSQRTGAPIVPAFCIRLGPGRYRTEVGTPIHVQEGPEGSERAMGQFNAILEGVIRRYPEQWLWFHDRWKSARRSGRL